MSNAFRCDACGNFFDAIEDTYEKINGFPVNRVNLTLNRKNTIEDYIHVWPRSSTNISTGRKSPRKNNNYYSGRSDLTFLVIFS